MTRLAADATSETIAELKALGVTAVGRYVSDFSAKNLTLAEAQRLTAAGIDIWTNWENDVDDWVGGYDQGVAYATRALAQHTACGGRTDELYPYWGIYFSVDEEVDPNDSTVHAYFQGINHVLTPRHTGCYGQTSLLRALRTAGLIACGDRGGTWRSMSSFGLPEGLGNPGEFDIEQTGQYNANYDRDVVNSQNAGQWRVGQKPQENDVTTFLISVKPDPTGAAGNTSSGIFTTDGVNNVVHVDGGSLAALEAQLGAPVVVTPYYYQGVLANRPSVTVPVTVDVDATDLAAAVVQGESDPTLLALEGKAIAHAEAVEEHNDTPAS